MMNLIVDSQLDIYLPQTDRNKETVHKDGNYCTHSTQVKFRRGPRARSSGPAGSGKIFQRGTRVRPGFGQGLTGAGGFRTESHGCGRARAQVRKKFRVRAGFGHGLTGTAGFRTKNLTRAGLYSGRHVL